MSPSFDNLAEDRGSDSEEELDFSGRQISIKRCINANNPTVDLRQNYDVRMEEGLDTFVIIDGLPKVPQESKQKLVKFLLKKLNSIGKTKEDAIFMPLGENNISEGCVLETIHRSGQAQYRLVSPSLNTLHPSKPSRPQRNCTEHPWTRNTHWL